MANPLINSGDAVLVVYNNTNVFWHTDLTDLTDSLLLMFEHEIFFEHEFYE